MSGRESVHTPDELDERVCERAKRLTTVACAVSECFGTRPMATLDPNALRDVLSELRGVVRSIPDAYLVIVGGLAVQEQGYERYTSDIDAVVDSAHYSDILDRLRRKGFDQQPDAVLKHRVMGIEFDLLREGALIGDSQVPLPHPRELGPNLGFATLPGLIRLKLEAHRRQGLADVVGLLKANRDAILSLEAQLPQRLRKEYRTLAEEARRECR